ncbi:MAG: hypothetical protein ABSG49_08505 [Methanoregula sp.]|jgi:hypothetical protein|uniref:hypothetical protein n=1 Tax=Methanoregula sp. TaxID=2052170 RepID=UPI003C1BCBB0
MKPPRIPPLLADIVQTGISAVDGVIFTEHSQCPTCGAPLSGYDTKRKQFAHLVTDKGPRTVYVDIKRFYCRNCHRFCLADNPFYPDTRIGSIIIDLCIALSMTMPVNRVPAYLAALGILVDRSSCRLYVQNNSSYYVRNNVRYIETNNIFGVHLPRSILTLSALAIDPIEGSHIEESDVLAACGFPSGQRTAANRPFPHPRCLPDHKR